MIYLDNSATTYPKPEIVYKTLDDVNRNQAFNAGRGGYRQSVESMKIIDEARKTIAEYVDVQPNRVIFSSSATESLNIIINGLEFRENENVYVSPFEHNAVIRPLFASKVNIQIIPFREKDWSVDTEKLENMFAVYPPKAIFLSQVSNVTGFIPPYVQIFAQGKKYNSINVLDCAQGFGIVKPEKTNADYFVFAGHKSMYGSFGAAGFIKLNKDELKTSKYGGTGSDSLNLAMPNEMPGKYEAGSQNVVAIAGMLAGFKWVLSKDVYGHELQLTNYLIKKLKEIDKITIYAPENQTTLGIVSISIDGYNSNDVATILSEDFNICVRSGYHCAPFIHDFIDSKKNNGTVRISMSYFTKESDLDALVGALKELV